MGPLFHGLPQMLRKIAGTMRLLALIVFCLAGPLQAEGRVDAIVDRLGQQGYSAITVSRTFLGRTRIRALGPTEEREIILNGTTGEIIRDYWKSRADSGTAGSGASGTSSNSGKGRSGSDDDDDDDDRDDDDRDDDRDADDDNSGKGSSGGNSGRGSGGDSGNNSGKGSGSNSGSGSGSSGDDGDDD
jgi:hypothetical protein